MTGHDDNSVRDIGSPERMGTAIPDEDVGDVVTGNEGLLSSAHRRRDASQWDPLATEPGDIDDN